MSIEDSYFKLDVKSSNQADIADHMSVFLTIALDI